MNRKPRKDSILHNLPPEQRAKVDRWLFDKGMSYAQVAEMCARFLGMKVSKSSVARYYQRTMDQKVQSPFSQVQSRESGAGRRVEELLKGGTWPGVYPKFVEGLILAALEATERYEFELRHEGYVDVTEARWFLRLMRLIIAARRAEHSGILAAGERAFFEVAAARVVLRIDEFKNGCFRTGTRSGGVEDVKTSWESKRPIRSTVCGARQGRQLPELKAEIAVQRTHQRRKSFRLFPPLTAFGGSFFEMHFWNAGMAVSGSVRPGQAKKVKTLDTEPRETRQASMSRARLISMSLRTDTLADCHHGALENFSRNHPSRARVCYLEPAGSKTGIGFDRAKN